MLIRHLIQRAGRAYRRHRLFIAIAEIVIGVWLLTVVLADAYQL